HRRAGPLAMPLLPRHAVRPPLPVSPGLRLRRQSPSPDARPTESLPASPAGRATAPGAARLLGRAGDDAGAEVAGEVRDDQGKPIEGAEVGWIEPDKNYTLPILKCSASRDVSRPASTSSRCPNSASASGRTVTSRSSRGPSGTTKVKSSTMSR